MPTLYSFKTKILKPCKTLLRLLKFPYKKPISIRAFKSGNPRTARSTKRTSLRQLVSVLWPFKRQRTGERMDRVMELKSFNERDQLVPSNSPLTPTFIKFMMGDRYAGGGDHGVVGEVEEACRSFENYLVEMIVEEGKVKDLTDVEELLDCWNSLKSPEFVDLVSRFYGELCKDLFNYGNQ